MSTFFYFSMSLILVVFGTVLLLLADEVVGALFLCTGILMSTIWHVKEELVRELKSISRH